MVTDVAKNKGTKDQNKGILQPFSEVKQDGMGLPEFRDLCDKLKFSPEQGRILLGQQRVLFANLPFFEVMRRELIEALGLERARGTMMRMGYSAGYHDADVVATEFRASGNAYDVLTAGPALHAIEGWVSVEPSVLEIDVAAGHYLGEFLWRDSCEAELHYKLFGASNDPVCWTQLGYAAGYGSRFMGKRLLYKETMCAGKGDPYCKVVGKPVEQWNNPEPELFYMHPPQNSSDKDLRPTHHVPVQPAHDGQKHKDLTSYGGMIGASPAFNQVCHLLQRVAKTNATVLFLGETGVGKERFARALHETSARADGPFIAINCAAIPNDLVEAELFGVVKGAYSGATTSRAGRFERAEGGTIFLDEVGTLNFSVQAKLLRVLQEREFERLGDERVRKVDTRIVAATNANLEEQVKAGEFRDDLWYRLNVYPIKIPPLRERRDDIPLLIEYFLKTFNDVHACTAKGYTQRAIEALLHYRYPGNIRELENIIERAVILASEHHSIDIDHLFDHEKLNTIEAPLSMSSDGSLQQNKSWQYGEDSLSELARQFLATGGSIGSLENTLVELAVEEAGGNLTEAARNLGITRRQLSYKYQKRNV